MWKRLWKNAILALCVLALVLQPLTVFADNYLYATYPALIAGMPNTHQFGNILVQERIYNMTDAIISGFYDLMGLSGDLSDGLYQAFDFSDNYGEMYLYGFSMLDVISSGNRTIYRVTAALYDAPVNAVNGNISGSNQFLYGQYQYESGTYTWIVEPTFGGNDITFISSASRYYFPIGAFGINSEFYAIQNYSDLFYDPLSYIPDVPPIDPSNPTVVTGGNYPLNIYMQLGLMFGLNFNSYTPDGSVHFNPTWVGVGQALTYDYLCKTNKDSATVSITLADGTEVSLDNYLYGEPNYTSSLSTIQSTLNTISSRANTTNTRLNTLNTSINNQMNAVNNKLDAAFPSNQAAINDFIAEDLMDDSGDNGLTINRIAQSKSDLDVGLDTFKLDTSQSEYSNPFSALSDADWSFWSQTTLNNLGSGYSYSFGEGSLMSEDDVFTENQNTLLDLLGW